MLSFVFSLFYFGQNVLNILKTPSKVPGVMVQVDDTHVCTPDKGGLWHKLRALLQSLMACEAQFPV